MDCRKKSVTLVEQAANEFLDLKDSLYSRRDFLTWDLNGGADSNFTENDKVCSIFLFVRLDQRKERFPLAVDLDSYVFLRCQI